MSSIKSFTPLAIAAGLLVCMAAPAAAQQAYAYQNIFDDNSGLTLNGLWAVDNTPAVPNGAPGASGGNNLNYNNGSDYAGNNSGTARTPTINMTGVSAATMTFWCRYQTEDPGTNYDVRWIRIFNATSGGQVYTGQFSQNAAAPLSCPSMSTWHQHSWTTFPAAALDIPIQIEFFFNTVDGVANNYQGWFIDDLEIIGDDATPPDAIDDLTASSPSLSGCTLEWTSPFDNDTSGVAASFDLRHSTAPITTANFNQATAVSGEPSPGAPGTLHTVTLAGLNPGTQYYFAIRSTDFAGNVSALSNIETVNTLALPPVGGSATTLPPRPKDRYNACSAGVAGSPIGLMTLGAILALAGSLKRIIRRR